jgi:hypothetical protein
MRERWLALDEIAAQLGSGHDLQVDQREAHAGAQGRQSPEVSCIEVDEWVKGGRATENSVKETKHAVKRKEPTES